MTEKCPKISVVLPCYNGASMLPLAIESCINQTFQDWELIIVNDCSTDNSLEVAKSYANKDKRIRVISNEVNLKLPASLNRGFSEARGQYLTWTSDDNIMLPEMLEKLSDYLDSNIKVSFVVSDYSIIDEKGNITDYAKIPDNLSQVMLLNNYVGACFMYKKEVLELLGGYDVTMFLVEDYEYWIRIWRNFEIGILHQNLYLYRKHASSLSNTKKEQISAKLLELRLKYLEYAQSTMKDNPDLLVLLYYRIVDNLKGKEKLSYLFRFIKQLPIKFGMRYIFIHNPHRMLVKMKNR